MIKVETKELKKNLSKLNVAIEKNAFNPNSGLAQLTVNDDVMTIVASSFDYYVEIGVDVDNENNETLNATVEAETLIPLISKIDVDEIELGIVEQTLQLKTNTSEYTFPLQLDMTTGDVKKIEAIEIDEDNCANAMLTSQEISSIATINAKGLADGNSYRRPYQNFIYVDNLGGETFTDYIYVNSFTNATKEFQFLLTKTQAQILAIFEGNENLVHIQFEDVAEENKKIKVKFTDDESISVVFVTQNKEMVKQFPFAKLRGIASQTNTASVSIERGVLNKALARLMVFDKKFGANVLDYSKIEWGTDSCKLVSVKSKNYEVIPYVSSVGAFEHESIIRFADLVEQLKAFTANEISIGYGETPAIAINAGSLKQLIPEIVKK